MQIANIHLDQLSRIKTTVRRAHDYFKHNYDRYNEFRRFVFDSSLREEDITLLMTLSRPQLEFNILEAYISRLLGEFSKQEPDIEVNAEDQDKADPMTIKVVNQHLRHVMSDGNNSHNRYEVYKDLLSGGFSTLKVTTKYQNSMSMNQIIDIDRSYDPTLCGFSQIARQSHKGDGQFCFELFPKTDEEFKEEFPGINIANLTYKREFEGFCWSYLNDTSKIILVADYYEKKIKEKTIVQVRDGKVMTMSKYRKMIEEWNDITMPPAIVGKPRKTQIESIVRYRLIDNQVIDYEETDFDFLPLIFVDGNSAVLKTPKNGNVRQFTRPYVYHAKGAQRLKNYAGIALANEIENTVQHKFMVAKEALPKEEQFLQAYKDVQKASTLVYNSVYEENPDQAIANPIREVMRVPAPPEIMQAFTGADSLIQNVLGSYDAALGINNNQLSGIAIQEAATQSNATAMPYINGFLQGYQRAAQIYVALMPKYYITPRTLPIIDEEGMRQYIKINQEDGMNMDFDSNVLQVSLKAGASFQIQKSRTIMMLKDMMGMSPLFAQFIAEKGLNFVLDNMEGHGIEELKQLTKGWVEDYEQQKQAAQQAQQQQAANNPAAMKMQLDQAKLQQQMKKDDASFAIESGKLQSTQSRVMADLHMANEGAKVAMIKAQTERFAKQIDLAIKHETMKHNHVRQAIETHHKVSGHR